MLRVPACGVMLIVNFRGSLAVKLSSTVSAFAWWTPLRTRALAGLSSGLASVGVGVGGVGGVGVEEPPPIWIVSVAVLSLGSDSRSEVTVAVSTCEPLPLTFVENLTTVEEPFGT